MRALSGQQVMVRIFFGESDRWKHRPLEGALLERLRAEGFAGATVFRGVGGFGANSHIHTTHLLELSADLPGRARKQVPGAGFRNGSILRRCADPCQTPSRLQGRNRFRARRQPFRHSAREF